MKKPYLVKVEIEYAVMAENEADAIGHAKQAVDDCFLQEHCEVLPLDRFPDGWEGDNLIYGGDEDMTLKQAAEQSDAYQSRMKTMKMYAGRLRN